jgi:hypothetical protein
MIVLGVYCTNGECFLGTDSSIPSFLPSDFFAVEFIGLISAPAESVSRHLSAADDSTSLGRRRSNATYVVRLVWHLTVRGIRFRGTADRRRALSVSISALRDLRLQMSDVLGGRFYIVRLNGRKQRAGSLIPGNRHGANSKTFFRSVKQVSNVSTIRK